MPVDLSIFRSNADFMTYPYAKYRFGLGICFAFLFLMGTACQSSTEPESFDQEQVEQEVAAAVWAFHAADTSRNAQAVINLLWPEYTMLADGHRIQYSDVVAGSPEFMASLSVFHTEWTDLDIIPISANAALCSFVFQDSLVGTNGEITKKRGPTSMLWEKRKGVWRLRYGDADHYPW